MTDLVLDAGAAAPWRPWPRGLTAIALFALAGNIKFQGLFACFAVSAVIGVECLGLRRMVLARRCALFGILVVANLAAAAWTIRNTVRFDNPFYPLQVVVAGKTIFAGPEDPYRDSTPPRYVLYGNTSTRFPGPIDFILSASEVDWTMRGVVAWYDIGSVTGNNPVRGGPARTGGWGGLFVLVNAWLLGMQLLRLRRLDDPRQRLLALNAALLVAVTALLPRAYELRYWLFLPLALIPVNLRFLCLWDFERKVAPHLLTAMLLYGMATAALSPKSGLLEPHLVSEQQRVRDMPPEVRQALTTTGRYCNAGNDLIFQYSAAATGIAGIVSHNPGDCR